MSNTTRYTLWTTLALMLVALAWNETRIYGDAEYAEHTTSATTFVLWRIGPWLAAIAVLSIYSFLFKDNPFYRFFEHVLLGTAMGFTAAPLMRDVIFGKCLEPIYHGGLAAINPSHDGNVIDLVLIFAAVVGLLWYFQFSKRYVWLSRLAMGITLGSTAGMEIKRLTNELLPQVTKTFKNVWVTASMQPGVDWATRAQESLEALVFVLGTCSVLMYFFFSFEQKHPLVKGSSQLGRYFLMVAMGAFFGNTFASRLSALIERCQFLLGEWLHYQ